MAHKKLREKPERSCLGCRETKSKDALLRFVLSPDRELVPDLEARLPGRGAYTCVSRDCLFRAIKARQFNRAFNGEVHVPFPGDFCEMLTGLMRNRILGCIGLANRAGKVVSGGAMVEDALAGSRLPDIVIVAHDVSDAIGERITALANRRGVTCPRILTKEALGDILGKSPRSALAVRSSGFAASLLKETERYRNFLGGCV